MTYNLIKRIKEYPWREDWTKTLEDTHWLFRNVAQVGKLTDKLDSKFGTNFGPGEKVLMDLMAVASIGTKGMAAYSYLKGFPVSGTIILGMSEINDIVMLSHYVARRGQQDKYIREHQPYNHNTA